jgi:hypothetical protein
MRRRIVLQGNKIRGDNAGSDWTKLDLRQPGGSFMVPDS